jgi:hypothetical protein
VFYWTDLVAMEIYEVLLWQQFVAVVIYAVFFFFSLLLATKYLNANGNWILFFSILELPISPIGIRTFVAGLKCATS